MAPWQDEVCLWISRRALLNVDQVPASDEEHSAICIDINLANYIKQAFVGITHDLDTWEAQEEPLEEEKEEEKIEVNISDSGKVNSGRHMNDEAKWKDDGNDRNSNYDSSTHSTPSMLPIPPASNPPSGYATPSSFPLHLAPAAVLEAKLVYFSQFRKERKGKGEQKRSRSNSRSRSDQGEHTYQHLLLLLIEFQSGSQSYAQGENKGDEDEGKGEHLTRRICWILHLCV